MGESIYAGCKAAVIAFSKTIAREHARDNIRVNVVSPGITKTALYDTITDGSDFGAKVMGAIGKDNPNWSPTCRSFRSVTSRSLSCFQCC